MAEDKKNRERSVAEILAIKAFYDAGASLFEVGARFGLSTSRVEQIFLRNNIKTRRVTVSKKFRAAMRRRRVILDKALLIRFYIEEKLSIQRTAEKLNAGSHAVRRNLQDYGIPVRPVEQFTRSRLTAELLETLYIDKNLTAAQVADRLGYATRTIGKKLSQLGIRKRDGAATARQSVLPGSEPSAAEQSGGDSGTGGRIAAAPPPPPEPEPPPPLTVKEIARQYRIHPGNFRKLIKSGAFPGAYREIVGKIRQWRVPVADLVNFTPRARGKARTAAPTVGTILSRYQSAKRRIKAAHGCGKSEIAEMIESAQRGALSEEIAVRYRLDSEVVADLLAGAALRKPRPPRLPPVKRAPQRLPEKELIELYVNEKASTAYILEKLNTNYASLYINLRHYGIPLRDRRLRSAAQENETRLHRLAVEENLAPAVIAERLGLSEAYVKRKINEITPRLKSATL